MKKSNFKYLYENNWVPVLIGSLIGIVVTFVALVIFAFVYTVTDIDEYYNAVFATLSLIIGCFFGARFTVGKIKNKGFLNGAFIGLIIFILTFIISLFISENSFSLTSLFHAVCTVLSGGVSGIIRVNKEMNKKYLK